MLSASLRLPGASFAALLLVTALIASSPASAVPSATYTSCTEVLQANPNAASGVYTLVFGNVYCDMDTTHGGWALAATFEQPAGKDMSDFSQTDYSNFAKKAALMWIKGTSDGVPTATGPVNDGEFHIHSQDWRNLLFKDERYQIRQRFFKGSLASPIAEFDVAYTFTHNGNVMQDDTDVLVDRAWILTHRTVIKDTTGINWDASSSSTRFYLPFSDTVTSDVYEGCNAFDRALDGCGKYTAANRRFGNAGIIDAPADGSAVAANFAPYFSVNGATNDIVRVEHALNVYGNTGAADGPIFLAYYIRQGTPGWFVSDNFQSCTDACAANQVCNPTSMRAITSTTLFSFVNSLVGNPATCSSNNPNAFVHAPSFGTTSCNWKGLNSACDPYFAGKRLCCCSESGCPLDNSPVACQLTQWSAWSCSVSCGVGTAVSFRTTIIPASFGGQACASQTRTSPCNIDCPVVSVDCAVGEWSNWLSACPLSCGGSTRSRTRTVSQPTVSEGAACPSLVDVDACNSFPCPVDCVVSAWTDFDACTVSCGGGSQTRSRSVVLSDSNGGDACPNLSETQACSPNLCPVDCVVGEWSDFSSCTMSCGVGGVHSRSRSITSHAVNGGAACPSLTDTNSCTNGPCPGDCVLSEWADDGQCSLTCGGGMQSQTRTVLVEASAGGAPCGELSRDIPCNAHPCPIDCVLSEWTEYASCSVSCGGGVQIHSRTVTTAPQYGGAPCDNTFTTSTCNSEPCPVDCVLNDWASTDACSASCGGGSQPQTRTVAVPDAFGGAGCGSQDRTVDCNTHACPVDCTVSEWGDFEACPVSCGGAQKIRSRTITTNPLRNGAACPALIDSTACGEIPCPTDCVLGDWVSTAPCSATCDGGLQCQTRSVLVPPADGGDECGDTFQKVACNEQPCPVDCVLSEWALAAACSVSCGGGHKMYSRTITTAPQHGGAACEVTFHSVECNPEPCPIDCVLNDWASTDACSVSCGGGSQPQTRTVAIPDAFGGAGCGSQDRAVDCNTHACPVDCVVSEWADQGSCTASCALGGQFRTRSITTAPAYGGVPCDVLTSVAPCDAGPCPVDCVLDDWVNSGDCSATCGTGIQIQIRNVLQPDLFGGVPCGQTSRGVPCNPQPCPIDCELGEWADFGTCSVSCGSGVQVQKRDIVIPAAYGGLPCDANQVRTTSCTAPEPCPVDCVLSDWSDNGECTAVCGGGSQCQTRYVVVAPVGSGLPCDELVQKVPCNDNPCPIDCELSEWALFASCSVSCGGGVQVLSRTITTAPEYGGAPCDVMFQPLPCNPEPCPVDCVLNDWASTDACSASCGGGLQPQTRTIAIPDAFGGAGCDSQDRTVDCNTHACPVDCAVSEWSDAGSCSANCEIGGQLRLRSVTTAPAYGGVVCDALTSVDSCFAGPCPVDCVLDDWADNGDCSVTCGGGIRNQIRAVLQPDLFGGAPCGQLSRDVPCNEQACPVDCVLSEWADFGDCSVSCGGGSQERIRTVTTYPSHGGASCEAVTTQVPCNAQPCPVDCVLNDWASTDACSASCGGGSQPQTRTVAVPDAFGGAGCGSQDRTVDCNTHACPVDCAVSEWSDAGSCSAPCGVGAQFRTRSITTAPAHGGVPCDALTSVDGCFAGPCPTDCVLGEWTSVGGCSASCAGGMLTQIREIVQPDSFGGAACGEITRDIPCNPQPCPVNCELGPWADFGTCSVSCGTGFKARTRTAHTPAANGGAPCDNEVEVAECNTDPCPVDCVMSSWVDDGPCSHTCGEGLRPQTRTVITDAAFSGASCGPLTQQVACNPAPCPVNCQVTSWAAVGSCTVSCGSGVQVYTRTVTVPPVYGGADCPDLVATSTCNAVACPVDCTVGDWTATGSCSASCGGTGVQAYTRSILTPPVSGGAPCPVLTDSQPCNLQNCPLDCIVSDWLSWSPCTVSCGTGTQGRTRLVYQSPNYGGATCPSLAQTQNCNTNACPVDCVVSQWTAWTTCTLTCGQGTTTRSRSVITQAANGGVACPTTYQQTSSCSVLANCPIDCRVSEWVVASPNPSCSVPCASRSVTRTRRILNQAYYGGMACPALTQVLTSSTPCHNGWVLSAFNQSCTAACMCSTNAACSVASMQAVTTGVHFDYVNSVLNNPVTCNTKKANLYTHSPSFQTTSTGTKLCFVNGSSDTCSAIFLGQRFCCCSSTGCPNAPQA